MLILGLGKQTVYAWLLTHHTAARLLVWESKLPRYEDTTNINRGTLFSSGGIFPAHIFLFRISKQINVILVRYPKPTNGSSPRTVALCVMLPCNRERVGQGLALSSPVLFFLRASFVFFFTWQERANGMMVGLSQTLRKHSTGLSYLTALYRLFGRIGKTLLSHRGVCLDVCVNVARPTCTSKISLFSCWHLSTVRFVASTVPGVPPLPFPQFANVLDGSRVHPCLG